MSDIDTISTQLRVIAAGVDRAQAASTVAEGRAGEIAARAVRSGFTGIAAGMSRVRGTIIQVRTSLAGVSRCLVEATAAVAAAPTEPSPEQTLAALVSASEKVTAGREGLIAATATLDEAEQQAIAVLRGGQPGPMLAALGAITQILGELTRQTTAATQHIEAATTAARQVGGPPATIGAGATTLTSHDHPGAPVEVPGYPFNRPHPISWSDLHHVCHGDPDNDEKGGHLHGTGRPGKTEFPPDWDDEKVAEALTAAAAQPSTTLERPNGVWYATGTYEDVTVTAVVRPDGSIAAGWPISGPGVRQNPPRK